MNLEKFSNILALVMFSALILGAVAGFVGQMFPAVTTQGFFAYVLNLFASPITMFFHMFVGWSGNLFALYFILCAFFVIGIVGLCIVLWDIKTNQTKFALRVTRFVFEIFLFAFGVLLIVSLSIHGFGILNDSSVWSGSWLIILIFISFVSLCIRAYLLHEETKSSTTFLKSHEN